MLHNFYRAGEEDYFSFDATDMMRKGHDFRDYICPDSMEKHADYIKIGEKFVRVLYLKDYASYIKDSMVSELTELNRNMMLSMEELFKLAFATWVRKDSRSRYEAMSILYKILSELQKDSSVHDSKFQILKPAVAYINENFIKKIISYEDMALACGISTSYLKKLFTECYKIPPRQYVIKMKINFACDLLIDHHYSVSEIAEMAGFGDIYYFSRIFKKETGLSPTEYQHKYRSSK